MDSPSPPTGAAEDSEAGDNRRAEDSEAGETRAAPLTVAGDIAGATAGRSSRRLRLRRNPLLTGAVAGAAALALIIAGLGVVQANAQSSDAPTTSDTPTTSDAPTTGSGDDDNQGQSGDENTKQGHSDDDESDLAALKQGFAEFERCLADAGIDTASLSGMSDSAIHVEGPDGYSMIELGDGSVTITRSGDELTITTSGDATVLDEQALKARRQANQEMLEAAFASCHSLLAGEIFDMAGGILDGIFEMNGRWDGWEGLEEGFEMGEIGIWGDRHEDRRGFFKMRGMRALG